MRNRNLPIYLRMVENCIFLLKDSIREFKELNVREKEIKTVTVYFYLSLPLVVVDFRR